MARTDTYTPPQTYKNRYIPEAFKETAQFICKEI